MWPRRLGLREWRGLSEWDRPAEDAMLPLSLSSA